MKHSQKIPDHIQDILKTFRENSFEAYLVGGCVRDILREKTPKDWDITTNAQPEEILGLFEDSFYENDYGTVGIIFRNSQDEQEKNFDEEKKVSHETRHNVSRETNKAKVSHETSKSSEIIEITPYRTETTYSNKRHPDEVKFTKNIEEDLSRRDFTMNAIAYNPDKGQFVDLYKGQNDIKDKIIRTVGSAEDRFREDALRMMRAVRLSTELSFAISTETQEGILKNADGLKSVSRERIRDELTRILLSDNPVGGFVMLHQLGLLQYILPELEEGIGVEQNGDHIYHVWEHNLRALQHAVDRNWPLHIRFAALLHDVGKPRTRKWSQKNKDWTFYNHEVVGGKMTWEIINRLKFSKDFAKTLSKLVRHHMFFSDIDQITLSAVRRLVKNVGPENVWDLMKIRSCDRIGMGRPKEKPYRLRKYEAMIEEATRAPVTVGMLKIDGKHIMKITKKEPGPEIGLILHALLEEVLEDPSKNTEEYLEESAQELAKLSLTDLKKQADAGKERQENEEKREVEKIRKRHHVS